MARDFYLHAKCSHFRKINNAAKFLQILLPKKKTKEKTIGNDEGDIDMSNQEREIDICGGQCKRG